ncbi:MAG TPA: GNAT family N-acetyltransferase [Candidatus Acidoferrum sp.]|nr:GNAT family N-acetyltransferase [Candidatus Acidoferrum sp.]
MSDYFLTSARMGFRCWREEDLPLAVSLWGDVNATRLIGGPFKNEQIRTRIAVEISNLAAYRVQFWPVFFLSDNAFMGCCGFRPRSIEDRIFELGYAFLPAYWGKGFALESAKTALTYARETIGAKGFFAGHHPENIASRKILEKLGFHFTHQELYAPTGKLHPSYSLALTSTPEKGSAAE